MGALNDMQELHGAQVIKSMGCSAPVCLPTVNNMVRAKKFVYVKPFVCEPKRTDLELVEEELPALEDGEFLCEAVYLSVDPYMRPYMARFKPGVTMIGQQVAKIIESRNKKYPVGKYVAAMFGWRNFTISKGDESEMDLYVLPDFGELPLSLALGILGMPGNTAYFGFLDLCEPRQGETVVVSGAAGAVGSIVGQIAKLKGCTVIGIAGSSTKCEWLIKELGFDKAINYSTQNVAQALKESAPKGIDCYFDNVGGEISSAVISQMNERGRISVCGAISTYNDDPSKIPLAPMVQPTFVFKQLRMEGFIVRRWADRWLEGITQNLKWVQEGKIKYRETVTEGFEKMFDAFIDMLKGGNTGKALVKV